MAPLSYQWQKNGVIIAGATKSTYVTPATTLADNGSSFTVVVSNSAGSATSRKAQLIVTSPAGKSGSSRPAILRPLRSEPALTASR